MSCLRGWRFGGGGCEKAGAFCSLCGGLGEKFVSLGVATTHVLDEV